MSENSGAPVFFDPQQRRWRRFKRAFQLLGAVLSIIFGVLIISVLVNPALPSLGLTAARTLPQSHHLSPPQHQPIPTNRAERQYQRTKGHLANYLAGTKRQAAAVSSTPAPTPGPPGRTEIIGFYVNWDDTSFTSLRQNINQLDKLIPEWLHLTAADGTISVDDPYKTDQAIAYVREHRPNLAIAPLVNNFNSATMEWEKDKLAAMLADPAARARAIQQLVRFVRDHNFSGISIDFENVPPASQHALKAFEKELWDQFHPLGLEVSQSVPLDDPTFDYRGLAEVNDYLILMAYDEHESTSDAGPVASQRWYSGALKRRFAELPSDKYVISVGNYGYDWTEKQKTANEISFQEALTIAKDNADDVKDVITLDSESLNPAYDYEDEQGSKHHVWFLNALTTFNQMVEGNRYLPRGYALWRLGSEDPSVWTVFERRRQLNRDAAIAMQELRYGYDIDYEGQGEVLHVASTPHDGRRQITYNDQTGLITSEKLTSDNFPSPYVIERKGGGDRNKKKIALTFDDGPDARFTPQVLDVLKQYHVPATFFIVGINGDLNPDLLARIAGEGHEIGNHTFTHPNVAVVSEQQFRLELNATERLLESRIGRRSLLFRPPYAEDVEPETPDQVRPLLFTSDLKYYTIGMQIDPNDWRNPGADEIVKATIDGALNGEGNVVLLHDSGGDRSQTVAALPQIIEGLRSRGFDLVLVSDLMGKSRDDVMPAIPNEERLGAWVDDAGFRLINWVSAVLHNLFVVGIVLGLMRLLFIGILALGEWWVSRHTQYPADFCP